MSAAAGIVVAGTLSRHLGAVVVCPYRVCGQSGVPAIASAMGLTVGTDAGGLPELVTVVVPADLAARR